MKIWLPTSIYKIKPFLLLLISIMLFMAFKNKFIRVASVVLFCYAGYILVIRLMWADSSHTKIF